MGRGRRGALSSGTTHFIFSCHKTGECCCFFPQPESQNIFSDKARFSFSNAEEYVTSH